MRYIESSCTDPRWNLAMEEYVFSRMDPKHTYFILWQNHNTIVIGKNQNTVAEVNAQFVKENDISVVRRLSGGGAVYHDLGNLNFTFIADADKMNEIDFGRFCLPVIQTLQKLGIPAELNGRNDMTIQGKKFSGNSQYTRNGRVLHHGTLLFSSNLGVVSQALQVNKEKLLSKGISSVSSRVCNISDYLPEQITIADFKRELLRSILQSESPETYIFSPEDLDAIQKIKETRYDLWDWNYGYSPRYEITKSRRFEGCGTVEVSYSVDRGVIQGLQFLGDFFHVGNPDELAQLLTGCCIQRQALEQRLSNNLAASYIKNLNSRDLVDLISEGQ